MKHSLFFSLFGLLAAIPASAQSLYSVGIAEPEESLPLKWTIGADLIYDDNVAPGGPDDGEDSLAINPYVGASFVSHTPQTILELYARLGLIYYFDGPNQIDDVYSQSRLGLNLTHNVSERLRFMSRNFISYELEPDYSYGYSSSRTAGEYLYWQTDNSIGFRWTERFGTYTGIRVGGLEYADLANNDRLYVEPYNQFRYQLTQQTVLTAEYRYRWTYADGGVSDAQDQYILVGAEHRFSETAVGVFNVGAQIHQIDGGDSEVSPYMEGSLRVQMNEQFSLRGYARYGYENWETVSGEQIGKPNKRIYYTEFDELSTLRLGLSGSYAVSDRLTLQAGVDYIKTTYESGSLLDPDLNNNGRHDTYKPSNGAKRIPVAAQGDSDVNMFNVYAGFSVKLTEYLYANASYNYTTSSSDLAGRDYDRNRISVGLSAQF